MKILHVLETVANPQGIFALSPNEASCLLAVPASEEKGDIFIFDAFSLQPQNVIHAHKAPLSRLAIDPSGAYVASTSSTGTVIRVSSIPKPFKVYEFRRGTISASISSISFNQSSSMICVASNTGTIHVFSLDQSRY